jgi:hypothetical protein
MTQTKDEKLKQFNQKKELFNKLTESEKEIFGDMNNLFNNVRSYKMVSKSIFFEKIKNSESCKMSLRVKDNYEKKLKEMYFRIKKCSKEEYEKLLKILNFSESRKKDLKEALLFVEDFLLKK